MIGSVKAIESLFNTFCGFVSVSNLICSEDIVLFNLDS